MALDVESSYRFLGTGDGLALEVSGPTMVDCLARAVEGLSASHVDVHPAVIASKHPLDVDTDASPAALLLAVLEGCMRLGQDGHAPVSLSVDDVTGISIEAVPARSARLLEPWPPVLVWHELALEQVDGGWRGRIIASR